MKKIALTLSVVALLASCRKPEEKTLSVTETTGTATVKGVVTKNIFTNNGGTFTSNGQVAAQGAKVIIRVAKSALYPSSGALGFDTYMTTTDAQGLYSLDIKTSGNGGTNAGMVIEDWMGTLDTLLNGTIKTGLAARFPGTQANLILTTGGTQQINHNSNGVLVNSNPNNNNMMIGTASISGTVGAQVPVLSRATPTNAYALSPSSPSVVPVVGRTVYMSFDKDPFILMSKMYTTTTSAGGAYTFTFNTVAMNTPGMNQNASIWVADYSTVQDTVKTTTAPASTITVTGKTGVYGNVMQTQNSLFNNEIRNAVNFTYGTFTAN